MKKDIEKESKNKNKNKNEKQSKDKSEKKYVWTPTAVVVAMMVFALLLGVIILRIIGDRQNVVRQTNPKKLSDNYITAAYKNFDVKQAMSNMAFSKEKEEELKNSLTETYKSSKENVEKYNMELSFDFIDSEKLDEEDKNSIISAFADDVFFDVNENIGDIWLVRYKMTLEMKANDYKNSNEIGIYVGIINDELKVLCEKEISSIGN